jgi:UDP-4-amino-4,6-dideoxy-N-acetyl-beta-L-altrosamine transaminase
MASIPYSRQSISEEDISAVCDVLRSDYLTQGPAVPAFEDAFAERHEVAHAVAVINATAGLHLACLALGVRRGNRVWTSPNSFLASANCALYCDAEIDFVDIDPRTRNLSVDALREKLEVARRKNEVPAVVIPVDFGGLPCDLNEIRELADTYGFKVLEDASHATGASYLGRPVASEFSDVTVFSFHAVKIVTTAEGGLVTTRDSQIAQSLRLLRSHGMTRESHQMECEPEGAWYYEQTLLGFNARMTDIQAALGRSQLARLDTMRTRREELANRYDTLLAGLPLLLPARLPDRLSAWHLYPVEIDEAMTAVTRAHVFRSMREAGIGVNVHYIPIHTQPYYARLGFKRGDFPASERYYSRAISLPLFPTMTQLQQDQVVEALSRALRA